MKLKKVKAFYKKRKVIPKIILSKTDKHEIIHGAQAINKQLPKYLKRPTQDYDIYSKSPRKDAREVERALDKKFGGNYFYVRPAKHKGTYKVKSYVADETFADYTKPKMKIPSKKIGGYNYATLGYFKEHIKKTLKDPSAEHRFAKDKDALYRIKLAQKKR